MNDDLASKGKLLIQELGEEAELSKKWMAYYIAELMDRAESGDEETRRQASDLCADLIIKLWKIRLKSKIIEVERKLQSRSRNRMRDDTDERYEKLKDALANPENIEWPTDVNLPLNMNTLRDIESDVIRLLLVAEAIGKPAEYVLDEIARDFNESDAEALKIQRRLAKVFPAFDSLPLTDLEEVRKNAIDALHRIEELRCSLLWSKTETQDQESREAVIPKR